MRNHKPWRMQCPGYSLYGQGYSRNAFFNEVGSCPSGRYSYILQNPDKLERPQKADLQYHAPLPRVNEICFVMMTRESLLFQAGAERQIYSHDFDSEITGGGVNDEGNRSE